MKKKTVLEYEEYYKDIELVLTERFLDDNKNSSYISLRGKNSIIPTIYINTSDVNNFINILVNLVNKSKG
jgi:hypothetical protein